MNLMKYVKYFHHLRCSRRVWIILSVLIAAILIVDRFTPTNDFSIDSKQAIISSTEMSQSESEDIKRGLRRDIRFKLISSEKGLPGSSVYSILQDSRGFLWVGTDDGLSRYDGYTFKVYRNDPENPHSLSCNDVTSIYEDTSGILWIGTNGGGLNRFDRETEQFAHYKHDPDNPHSLSYNSVSSLHEDQTGTLWVGTEGGGLNRFDKKKERFTWYHHSAEHPNSLSDNVIWDVYEDQNETLWIGTRDGLDVFDREAEQFIHYRNNPADPHSLCSNEVMEIYEDQSGGLWVGTAGGLAKFNQKTRQFISYRHDPSAPRSLSNNRVISIFEDQSGRLWIGTEGGGLNLFHRKTEQFTHYKSDTNNPDGLHSNYISAVYEDRSGVLWIGSYGGGLLKTHQKTAQFLHYRNDPYNPDSLSHNAVSSIYYSQSGILWIGTFGGGLNKIDWKGKTEGVTHYRHDSDDPHSLSHNSIWAICEDHLGVLWVGTEGGGLNKFDHKTEQFVHYRYDPSDPGSLSLDVVSSVYEDHLGTLWIGTLGGGLNKFQRETEQFTHYHPDPTNPHSLSEYAVLSIYEDRSGILWIGTFGGGLNRFDRETEQFTHYRNEPDVYESLSNNTIWSIYEDRSERLWIGTSGGLNTFDRATETFTHYRKKDGLPNETIYGILEDTHGNLWLSTNNGVAKFDPQTDEFKTYNEGDGLQSDRFHPNAFHKSSQGEMFFGGINGFNAFHPEKLQDNPYVPPIVFTDFQIFNQSVRPGAQYVLPAKKKHDKLVQKKRLSPLQRSITETTELTLSYKERVFSIEFAALDFTIPEKNQYAYMMEGFDEEWIYSGTRRFAQYTDLPEGNYIFKVKGTNNDGIWNEEGISLNITVTPPFWRTFWFRAFILGMFVLGYIARVKGIKQHRKLLEIKVNERTKELQENMRRLEDEVVERKHAEEALKKSEEYNRLLIETMNEGLVVVDKSWSIIYVNSKFCEMFGYSRDEMIGHSVTECLDTTNLTFFQKEHLTAKKEGRSQSYEIEWLRKDGSKIPTITSPQTLVDHDGNFTSGVVVLTDITALKHVEEELREAKAFTESIISNVPEVIYSTDGNMKLTYISSKCEQLYGYTVDEFFHAPDLFTRMIHPDDQEKLIAQLKTIMSGNMVGMEYRVIRKDGRIIWVRETAIPSLNPRGRLKRIDASVYDITELKRAEEDLRESEEKYRVLFENLQNVFYRADNSGNILLVSPSCKKVFGYSPEEAVGLNLARDIYAYPEQRRKFLAMLREKGYVDDFELQLKRKDGGIIWGSVTSHFYKDKEGKVLGLEGTVMDITERKQTEEQLIEANIELRTTLDDLKRTQSQLIRSEKMAALGQLIAGVAHEINTPLGAIRASIGNISYALNEASQQLPQLLPRLSPTQQANFFALVQRALQDKKHLTSREERKLRRALRKELETHDIKNADEIADTLVDMGIYNDIAPFISFFQTNDSPKDSRTLELPTLILQAGYNLSVQHHNSENIKTAVERAAKVVFALKSYAHYDHTGEMIQANIVEGIEVVLTLYYNQLKYGIEVVKQYEEVPAIRCYPDELNQVWTNIIQNALQAMDGKGRLEITIVSRQYPVSSDQYPGSGNQYIVVQITDSGCGIPEGIKERIFEPFFTTKPSGEGSGLGLDIVKKIIDKHQGNIEFESQPGRTTFSIWLPISIQIAS